MTTAREVITDRDNVRNRAADGGHDLVGIISRADFARHLSGERAGELFAAISPAPASD